MNLIKPVIAAQIPLGNITGVGDFQTTITDSATTKTAFSTLLSQLIGTITVVGGLAFVIFFTVGGLKWLTSGGDKGKVTEAQTQMTQAAIGLIAMAASYFIAGIVGGVLGINIFNPLHVLFPNIFP